MRRLLSLLAVPMALAHTGEPVEEHGVIEMMMDALGSFFAEHGMLVFGILFGIAVVVFLFWFFRDRR